jgi:Tfp pilus assembly protein FimT
MENKLIQDESGWTLIEIILILFLWGSWLWMVYPTVSHIGDRLEREMLLELLASELQLAQTEAKSRQQEVEVIHSAKKIQIVQAERSIRLVELPKQYQLKSNYPKQRIVFRKTGQVRGGTMKLFQGKHMVGMIKIQVASGRSKVEWEGNE